MSASSLPPAAARRRFRRNLLVWYRAHGRRLPWRNTSDPYHILVSEVMLQQTQVERVLPKYQEWLEKYPSLEALASAPEDDVSATWRPLGYNIRPRRLHAIACESVMRYGGQLPSDEQTLLSFKGIGAYTAGAIRSFAFRQRAAILDTNVARVLFRVFVGRGDSQSHRHPKTPLGGVGGPRSAQGRLRLQPGVDGPRRPRVRGPKTKCLVCPMAKMCASYPWKSWGLSWTPQPLTINQLPAPRYWQLGQRPVLALRNDSSRAQPAKGLCP